MRRREFISLLGGATAAWPLAAHAQQSGQMRRIGVLLGGAADDPQIVAGLTAFKTALAELGWIDGRNIQIAAARRQHHGLHQHRGVAERQVD
jgi:hypothetical protein